MQGKCNVCGEETEVVVACSATGAVSFAYCKDCWCWGLEPYGAIVASLYGASSMDDVAEWYQPIIQASLEAIDKTEEELFKDVEVFGKEYEEAITN